MERVGFVDAIGEGWLSGWVKVPEGDTPEFHLEVNGEPVLNKASTSSRPDLAKAGDGRVAFKLEYSKAISRENVLSSSTTLEVKSEDVLRPIEFWQVLRQAMELEAVFRIKDFGAMRRNMNLSSGLEFFQRLLDETESWPGKKARKGPVAVVCLANDAGGWFPYFFQYYSKLFGADAIHVATSEPEGFADYPVGMVYSLKSLPYDNALKSQLMSGFSNTLLSLYDWVLVCDVDEFIVPHPESRLSFLEMLDTIKGPLTLPRGFDILQLENEHDFDFEKGILDQRRTALYNTAISKPQLTRVPLRWSGGFHYCDRRPQFEAKGTGFLSLHLKWACKRVRAEVAEIVRKTTYASDFTNNYALASVESDAHPQTINKTLQTVDINDALLDKFEEKYYSKLKFSGQRMMWVGEHMVSDFLVDLGV